MLQFASGYVVSMSQLKMTLGWVVSVLTEKNVAIVKTLIEEDASYTVQEIYRRIKWHSFVKCFEDLT